MPSKLASLALVAALATLAFVLPTTAAACSCMYYPDPGTVLHESDVIFRGRVKELRVPQVLQPGFREIEPPRTRLVLATWAAATVIVVLEVEEAWKGVYTQEIEIDVGSGWCCDCSFGTDFAEPGEELIVFAYERENGRLGVSTCSPPVRSEHREAALEELGPGNELLLPGRAGDDYESDAWKWRANARSLIGVFGVVLVLVAFIGVVRARERD